MEEVSGGEIQTIALARISHTFSDSSHTLHDDLASQVDEAVLHEHCPRLNEKGT
jgi:ABC-type iron transport system FetAB ATPase subunit